MTRLKASQENSCWICKLNVANSREHEIKNTDLSQRFQKGGFYKKNLYSNDEAEKIQGPDSAKVKYPFNICRRCNDTRSQEWDTSYTTFMKHTYNNEKIKIYRTISLYNIWENSKLVKGRNDLFLYFIKHFGCALDQEAKVKNLTLPPKFSECLMSNKNIPTGLKISISYSEYWKDEDGDFLKNLEVTISGYDTKTRQITKAMGFEQFEALNIQYWFNENINEVLGIPWNGKKNTIRLGSHKI